MSKRRQGIKRSFSTTTAVRWKCQCFSSNRNQCKNKTSAQAAHQKMRRMPGGLKSLANEATCFRRCLGGKRLQNNQSLRLLCLWGWKAAPLSLLRIFFYFIWKMLRRCGGCGCYRVMRICTTASCQMPCKIDYFKSKILTLHHITVFEYSGLHWTILSQKKKLWKERGQFSLNWHLKVCLILVKGHCTANPYLHKDLLLVKQSRHSGTTTHSANF